MTIEQLQRKLAKAEERDLWKSRFDNLTERMNILIPTLLCRLAALRAKNNMSSYAAVLPKNERTPG